MRRNISWRIPRLEGHSRFAVTVTQDEIRLLFPNLSFGISILDTVQLSRCGCSGLTASLAGRLWLVRR